MSKKPIALLVRRINPPRWELWDFYASQAAADKVARRNGWAWWWVGPRRTARRMLKTGEVP